MLSKNLKLYCGVCAFLVSSAVSAHGRWIVPSHTILSGERPEFVTFDISISNNMFFPDHSMGGIDIAALANKELSERAAPPVILELMRSTKLELTKPDGSVQNDYALVNLVRKSVTAVKIEQDGTYRASVAVAPIYFTWFEDSQGELRRKFGRIEQVKPSLPESVNNIRSTRLINSMHSYITRNNISAKALEPSGSGLELDFSGQHPNELFSGEGFSFRVLFNGSALEGADLHFVRGGVRYRNDREEIKLKTGKNGLVNVDWPSAGAYLLELEHEVPSAESGIESDTHALYVTFEVMPE
jgi:hypothetical protein